METQISEFKIKPLSAIPDAALKELTPSVYEHTYSEKRSEKYNQFNTDLLIDRLNKHDWHVTKSLGGSNKHACHMLYCTHKSTIGKQKELQYFPQITVLNSHNGSKPLTIANGIFRLVCSNGLIVCTETIKPVKFYHRPGVNIDTIVAAIDTAAKEAQETNDLILDYNSIKLNQKQLREFADEAYAIRFGINQEEDISKIKDIDTLPLIEAVRPEDADNNLWTVFNRAQENMIRGGVYVPTLKGKVRKLRSIWDPATNWEINLKLWNLADRIRSEAITA